MTNEQLTQEIMGLKEHQAKAQAEHDKFNVVLTEVQEEIKENRELTIAVKEIATEMKHLREEQTDMNKRLKVIEDKPSKNWDNLIWLIITRSSNSCSRIFIRKIRNIERRVIYGNNSSINSNSSNIGVRSNNKGYTNTE